MKQYNITFLLVMLMCITSIKAFAYDCKVDGIYYNRTSATELEVAKGNYTGDIVIPSSVTYNGKTFTVTSIGNEAFYKCYKLTSVTIPNSVTSIGGDAFEECTSLTSITIPNSVTSIGNGAFDACYSLASITIPNSVTSIGHRAFSYCTTLTSITIPNSVTSIGQSAFYGCTSLASIAIPNSVTSIENYAFHSCTSLVSITIPNSVASIGVEAFSDCTSLTNITIPNSVTSIGDQAFRGCTSLESIVIPESVKKMGTKALFYGCTSLRDVTLLGNLTELSYYDFQSVYYGFFDGCTSLTSITLPNSVKEIDDYAFRGCSSLTSIIIGRNVSYFRRYAFKGCTALATIYVLNPTPPELNSLVFENTNYAWTDVYVPIGSLEKYQKNTYWKNFKAIYEFDPASLNADNVTINTTAGAGGQILVNGAAGASVAVKKGGNVTISFVPDEGYELKEARIDGKDVTALLSNGTYTLTGVSEGANISAVFAEQVITLTVQHAENGCLRQVVNKGEQLTFQIVAATGWKVNTVTMDGQDVTSQLSADGSYTTPAITKNATLSVSFESTNVGVRRLSASPVKVYANGSTLHIVGVENGESVSIYRADGTFVTKLTGNGNALSTQLPTGQVYLVRMQDKTVKICM